MRKKYSAILFDIDGTLIDTTELIFECFKVTCGKYGNKKVTFDEVLKGIGLPLEIQLIQLLGSKSKSELALIGKDHLKYQLSIYPEYLKVFPGVEDTLSLLKKRNAKIAAVTSRKIDSLELYLKHTGIISFFDLLMTPEKTLRHKPDPDPVLQALLFFKTSPFEGLMIGDSLFDIESGSKAGCDTGFVSWSRNSLASVANKPTYFIEKMSDILHFAPT